MLIPRLMIGLKRDSKLSGSMRPDRGVEISGIYDARTALRSRPISHAGIDLDLQKTLTPRSHRSLLVQCRSRNMAVRELSCWDRVGSASVQGPLEVMEKWRHQAWTKKASYALFERETVNIGNKGQIWNWYTRKSSELSMNALHLVMKYVNWSRRFESW